MSWRTFAKTIAAGALAVTLSGCPYPSFFQFTDYSTYSSGNRKKVLFIGIDGVRPDALEAARAPYLDDLIRTGAYSDRAQTDANTVSAPGWSNLLTGVWSRKHGVKDNTFWGERYNRYPPLFTRLEELVPELYTISIVSWKPINDHIVPIADKRITHNHMDGDWSVTKDAIKTLTYENPDVLFVYLGDVDLVGHNYGFHPSVTRYRKEIEDVDKQVGYILQALRNRRDYALEDWLIICTTDHGGTLSGHGRNIPEDKTIFYLMSGPSVEPGILNPPPTQVDLVPTVLKHLGIPVDQQWKLDGQVRGLKE